MRHVELPSTFRILPIRPHTCDFNRQTNVWGHDMILYIENPKGSTKKLLELITDFSNVAGYKINIQKSVAFIYTNNELSERKTKKTIPFIIASWSKMLYVNGEQQKGA